MCGECLKFKVNHRYIDLSHKSAEPAAVTPTPCQSNARKSGLEASAKTLHKPSIDTQDLYTWRSLGEMFPIQLYSH